MNICKIALWLLLCINNHKFSLWGQKIHIWSKFQAKKLQWHVHWHVIFHLQSPKIKNWGVAKYLFWHTLPSNWPTVGRRELEGRRWRPRSRESDTSLCRGWFGSCEALLTSLCVWFSLRRAAGAMPDNTGKNSVGVGFRQPVTILMVSLRVMSSFLACALRLHTGEAYSAALYTRARAPVLKVEGLAPHDEPASRRRRLFLEDTLARSESRCCLYVSCLSSFTSRYVDVGLCGSGDPLTFTVSLRWASLVLRWKAVEVVFATLSFSLQVFRYPAITVPTNSPFPLFQK